MNNEIERIDLFESIDDKIVKTENVYSDDKTTVIKYTFSDGREYVTSQNKNINIEKIMETIMDNQMFKMPNNPEGIEKFCTSIIKKMEAYLDLKNTFRIISVENPVEANKSGYKYILNTLEKSIKSNLEFAAKVSPLWFGHVVPGFPEYHGANPYNIFGVDHKNDYLLEDNAKYLKKERDLILALATSNVPLKISEQELIECTSKVNALNQYKEKINAEKTTH